MARGLGIDVDRTFAVTFALGSGLAGLGGALAIEIVGLDPNFAFTYLVYVLIVVSVGGLGSIAGSFAAAMPDRHQRHRRQILRAGARRLPDLSGDGGGADVAPGRPVREALTMALTDSRPHPAGLSAALEPLASARDRVLAGDAAAVRAVSRTICRWRARSPSPRCSRSRSISSSAMPASFRSATPPFSASAPIPPGLFSKFVWGEPFTGLLVGAARRRARRLCRRASSSRASAISR